MAYDRTDSWKSMDFKNLGGFLATKREELKTFFEEHKKDGGFDMTAEEVADVRARNDELGDATKRWEELRELDSAFQENVKALRELNAPDYKYPHPTGSDGPAQQPQTKSIGERFSGSELYLKAVGHKHNPMTQYTVEIPDIFPLSVKVDPITTAAGYAPFSPRTNVVVDYALRRPVVADLIPTDPTSNPQIIYMEQTEFTNNADTTAEGAAKPQSRVQWTQRTVNVVKIATYMVVTDEQLDDVPGFRAEIDRSGTLMLQLAEEEKLLRGPGGDDMTGFYVKSGTQTQSAAGIRSADAFYLAMAKVRHIGFAEPTGHIMHPDNWTPIRLMKTLDGQYIWGSPSEAGPERLWGKPVIVTTAATANTGLTGDFQLYSHISRRMGITIIVGFINDDMVKNQRTVVIEMRESLEIKRAAAFCLVPNLTTTID